MKKFFSVLVMTVLSVTVLLSPTSNASALSFGDLSKEKKIAFLKDQLIKDIRVDYPNAMFVDESEMEYNKAIQNPDGEVGIYGPAPPLSYLEVYAAISTNHSSYEYFDQNQLTSTYDHGGEEMFIVTAELGYGYSRIAKLNGITLPEYSTEFIDLEGDSIVDGYYVWWDASGYEGGSFTYQNTSTNSPWNTMSDSMNIQ